MTQPEPVRPSWTPRLGAIWAWLAFVVVALTLCWPMLSGQFLAGDDQVLAGYGFRQFGAEYFRAHGGIPQWNPFLFGGLPFFGVIGHGDIFYPTAWLRWLVPTGIGMTFGFFIHLVIAGGAMYALLRGLRFSWTAAVTAGIGYELSGIVASQLSPGHDGKLFVSALAPLAFLALLKAIRHRRLGGYGAFALVIGLAILSPQVQMAYYLLVGTGLWALWLTFLDPERATDRPWIQPLGLALVAAGLGIGISMIQMLPIFTHVAYTPRGPGGPSVGWDYSIGYSYHLKELPTLILPQFNGVLRNYWGTNHFKLHTEYLGALVVALAILGLGTARRRGLLLGFGIVAGLFFLVSMGADTPFYRLWWSVMPMMSSVRAAGMAWYLVALPVCVWAACGIERLVSGEPIGRSFWWTFGGMGIFALLGAAGILQPVTEAMADEQMVQTAVANAGALQAGSIRLLIILLIGGGVIWTIGRRRLEGAGAAIALMAVVGVDNWSILKAFPQWLAPAEQTYASDQIIDTVRQHPLPYRVFDPSGAMGGGAVYQGSVLMAHEVPTVFGYHGMESKYFDELFGGKNAWTNQGSPSLWDLYAVEYVTFNQEIPALPGYHKVLGPVSFPNLVDRTPAGTGYLWQRDSAASWVRVVPGAVKVPEDRIVPTVADPGYPTSGVILYPDTASVDGASSTVAVPAPTAVTARLTAWAPGEMTVALDGTDSRTTYLLVAENWYPDWQATIDGQPAATHRANFAMLSVALPSGAREVRLRYDMASYHTGRLLTAIAVLGALLLIGAGMRQRRSIDG